ncbi:MAG: tRNA (adenosine(37)-N6)-dimethylallyltransferase MiaA [Sulfuriferula sp.]
MGPTASGKTGLAVELAQRLPVEIISVDSALVYRDMDIGTAKPDAATLAAAPHHLIDLIDPTGVYSAARFRDDALALMADITARGRVPLLVGGTMLYFKALRDGLTHLPQADAALRAVIEAEAALHGWPALHAELARLDPEAGARLQPTDTQRIQRALEVVRLTGRPMSDYWRAGRAAALPYSLLSIALVPADRAQLHERIAQRFDAMLGAGLVDEVRHLREKYPLTVTMPSMRCVGYRQVWEYLESGYGWDEMRDRGVFATRQLAKRQLTWLRGMQDIIRVEPCADDVGERVLSMVADAFGN